MALNDKSSPEFNLENEARKLSALYPQVTPFETSWNVLYPYQLIVLKVQKNTNENGTDSFSYVETGMQFTLPIPPQELNIDMPIATSVQPTLNGIIEQHGGAPFKTISLQGTTGVVTQKNRGGTPLDNNVLINTTKSIFAGTIDNVNKIAKTFKNVTDNLNVNKGIDSNNSAFKTGFEDRIPKYAIGFMQYLALERFIENYVSMKASGNKNDEKFGNTKDLRLAFAIWKEKQVYIVSGVQLSKKRSSNSPLEYFYSLQLKAWGRVDVSNINRGNGSYIELAARTPSIMGQLNSYIQKARTILNAADGIIDSVIDDPTETLHEILRETGLFLKDANNIKTSITDFPSKIQNDCINQIIKDFKYIQDNYADLVTQDTIIHSATRPPGKGSNGKYGAPTVPNTNPNVVKGKYGTSNPVKGKYNRNTGLDKLLEGLSTDNLALPPQVKDQVNKEKERVRGFGRSDFQDMKSKVQQKLDLFTDKVGQGDLDYHSIYGLSTDNMSSKTTAPLSWDAIFALSTVVQVLDYLSASSKIDPQTPTSIEYVAGLAERSGVAFKTPRSKFAIPFPYGFSLERLALQYLGDANRWEEIVVLNGLRSPYVDEEGFSLSLEVNGNENKVTVAYDSNLFIGQTVWLYGTTTLRDKRHIIDLTKIGEQLLVSLDGDLDLDKFTVVDNAKLEAFLPGTVNSQKSIYIPSDNDPIDDLEGKEIPGIDVYDPLLQISGIDLLLSQDGDLAITEDGDCKMAYGLANIVQTLKLIIGTPKGSLLQHPEYGFALTPGTSLADINAQDILSIARNVITSDNTFSGVKSASVNVQGSTVFITIEVAVRGTSQFIPVTFKVN